MFVNRKINFRDLCEDEVFQYFENIGEKKFRINQINNWIWTKCVNSFDDMNNIPKNLIDKLSDTFFIDKITESLRLTGKDKTVKLLYQTIDNYNFESVLISSKDRVTACISTQIGCALNCSFCATGKLGFIRNLTKGEIYNQVFLLNETCEQIFDKKLSNIVIMGMGEPLLNYENTLNAIKIICSETGLGMSPHRITLSTAGISDKIKQLADDNIKFNLSISLHSADNENRSNIMPVNNKYNLSSLKSAIKYFYNKTKIRITYEYLLLSGVNDSLKDAEKLSELTKISPCKINIIEYNSHENSPYKTSDNDSLQAFVNHLESKNLIVNIRKSKGQDINAACGQLANKKYF